MEKNIVVTMTVSESKRFENDCIGFKNVMDKFIEHLPSLDVDEDTKKMMVLAIRSYSERLEVITNIFRTTP